MQNIKKLYSKNVHVSRLILISIAWLIFMAITKFDKFFSPISFQTMAKQFPEFGLMAIGVMLCMIIGGIDLSVVGVANLTAITVGIMLKAMVVDKVLHPMGIPLAIVVGIAIGALAGLLNGVLISKIHIPAILATLGANELFFGIGIVITAGKAVSQLPAEYTNAMTSKIFNVLPVQFIIFVIIACIIGFLLYKTSYGIRLYMLGTSAKAAKFSGIKNDNMIIKTHVISGICAAMGGLIMLANYNSARSDYGSAYVLQTILIVVLGGVDPQGGKGKLSGVLLSIIVLQMLSSGLNRFKEINAFLIPLIWGLILVLVMVLNYFTENKKIKN